MKKLGCAKCGGMKKMQEGGIPPAPSRMQYIEAEKLKNKKKYYTPDNIYIGDPKKKKEIDAMIERKTKANTKGMDFSGKKKMAMGGPINKPMTYAKAQRGDTNQSMGIFGAPQIGQGAMDGKTGQMKKGGSTKSFPDLTGDGKVTKADVLKGRGVIKKSGSNVKMQKGGTPPKTGMSNLKPRPKPALTAAPKPKPITRYQKGGFNVTGQKPFASLGSKLGLGTGIAGIVGVAGKALADKIKSRREEKANVKATKETPKAKLGGIKKTTKKK